MALKGTLKDFSLSDIFQLIGHQKKSGSLFIKTPDKRARVIFDDGKVILCTFLESDDQFLLGTMLVNAGIINKEKLQEAILTQQSQSKSIGDTLIQLKYITPQILSEFIKLQIDEVLFRIFEWTDGQYEFIPEKIRFNKLIIESQSAEAVLMDSFRKRDEWPKIKKSVGHFSQQLVRAPNLDIKNLKGIEQKIVQLIDGKRSIQDIIHLSRLGTFETTKVIGDLLETRRIQKIKVTSASKQKPVASYTSSLGWIRDSILPIGLTLALTAFLPFTFIQDPNKRTPYIVKRSLQNFRDANKIHRIEQALKVYLLEHGQYPPSLEDLGSGLQIEGTWKYTKLMEGYKLSLQWTKL